MKKQGKFIVLNPSVASSADQSQMASRLDSLDGKVLSVINNSKRNADIFLHQLLKEVQVKFNLQDIIWVDKRNGSLPMPKETLNKIKRSQAAITGVGD